MDTSFYPSLWSPQPWSRNSRSEHRLLLPLSKNLRTATPLFFSADFPPDERKQAPSFLFPLASREEIDAFLRFLLPVVVADDTSRWTPLSPSPLPLSRRDVMEAKEIGVFYFPLFSSCLYRGRGWKRRGHVVLPLFFPHARDETLLFCLPWKRKSTSLLACLVPLPLYDPSSRKKGGSLFFLTGSIVVLNFFFFERRRLCGGRGMKALSPLLSFSAQAAAKQLRLPFPLFCPHFFLPFDRNTF